ncbi:MAG: AMP-binding protein, partial [Candidatus Aminicenantes bacterium]
MFKEMTAGKLAVWANQRVKEREFWLNKLAGEWVKSHFPYDYKKKEELSHANVKGRKAVEAAKFQFTGELFTGLMQLSRGIDYAIHTIVTAGLILLMGKYSGCEDIVVGTPIYKQSFDGEFINMVLVLRNQMRSTMTFKELLLQVKQTIDKAVEHQNYPIEILPQQLDRTAVDGEGFPLFDVSILLEKIHDKKYLQHIDHNVAFTLKRKKSMLEGVVEYNTKLYLKESIERMINHFTNVFKQALSNVNIEISRIDILSQREKKQLLHEFNDTRTRYPEDKTIHELFKEEVEKTPVNIAVSWPVDLNDIYDQLESHTINPGLEKKIGSCCFKKNPYIYHSPLELPGKKSNLYILKNHRHNSVVVNHNIVKLIPLFDGKKNLTSIYSLLNALKKLNNKSLELLIYSMSKSDLLEVSFQFNDKVEIFSIDIFEHFIKLVQVLYKNHLIELSGVHPEEFVFEDSIRDDFEGDKFTTDEILLEDVLIKDRKISQAQVLLLGDTPGVPTTGLLYLASYLKRKGIKTLCQFYDPGRDYISMKENIEWLLEKIQPRVVAISLKWFLYTARVLDMCKIVKEYARKHSLDIKVVVGGNTASYYWKDIIKYDCIDTLVRGDGEEPLLKICRGDDISNIPNCAYKKNGEIIKNPITYVQDQTNSSEIYLSHLYEILLSHHASRFGIFFIYTQKGCAMNCLYCGGCNRVQQEAFNRKNIFRRGVEEVRKDIMAAKKYTSTFQFEFDILDKNLADYCRKIWEGIDLSGHFCLFSTLTPLSTELVELVSRTFKYVYWDFDICTPSERHRKQLESLGLVKPQPTDAEIMDFMTMCENFKNIEVRLNLITGLPYLTSDDIEPGEKLFSKIMNTYSCFGELHWARLHAQPGAPIVEDAGKHNMHSYATTFEDFLRYSKEIFNQDSSYSTVEDFNYPYIYFNDDQLNSRITNFYLETNKKIAQHTRNKKRGLIVSNTLTYRQLNEKAGQLAGALRAKGVKPGGIVGLMLERSIEIPAAILGILKAGCAYIPIDPEFPTGRIEYMLKDSSAEILLTTPDLSKEIKYKNGIVYVTDAINRVPTPPHLHLSPWVNAPATSLAYVIYTSG